MVNEIIKHWPGRVDYKIDPDAVHEANLLNLTVDKAQYHLGWRPVWNFERTIAETVGWYLRNNHNGHHGNADSIVQIGAYTADAIKMGLPWSL